MSFRSYDAEVRWDKYKRTLYWAKRKSDNFGPLKLWRSLLNGSVKVQSQLKIVLTLKRKQGIDGGHCRSARASYKQFLIRTFFANFIKRHPTDKFIFFKPGVVSYCSVACLFRLRQQRDEWLTALLLLRDPASVSPVYQIQRGGSPLKLTLKPAAPKYLLLCLVIRDCASSIIWTKVYVDNTDGLFGDRFFSMYMKCFSPMCKTENRVILVYY